ncbi:MAG: thiamine pyrophosphate-binding protein [Chloroflexi bacterium]|nr:thiamine pyrophosphate-binding protein [Chloroflexota bacterium]
MTTVAEVLAQTIRAAGIDTVFGLPGGENAETLDAMRREGLDFVLVRNESSAVFMADATARLTGKPSVALVTLGPGAANAYCGMAHAYLDRAPVLLVTAQSDGRTFDTYTHQVIDLQASFAPVTKMTCELTNVNTRQVAEEALRLTMNGRPGPVHLGISTFMAEQPVIENVPATGNPPSLVPDIGDAIDATKAFLAQAKRPIIVCGVGLEPEKPYEVIRQLAEAAQAPVIVTPKAKGAISDDHPLSVGTFGLGQTDPPYEVADECDCIVAVGFDVVEMERLWDQPQPVIWVAPWKNEDPVIAHVEHEFVGPMTSVLEQLAQADFDPHPNWGAARVAAFHESHVNPFLPEPAAGRLRPQTVLDVLRHHVPREAVVATDVGAHKICTGLIWPTYSPNSYLLSNGLSSMGFGLPEAMAAARVTGETAVCVTGDGGMAMVLGELGLLRDLDLPVIVLIMNDNALDLIRSAQRRRGKPVYGTEFVNPDFDKIAQAYEIDFYRVSNEEECGMALETAVAARKPVIIEALIDPISYPTTPK